jgi:hypothetical protein
VPGYPCNARARSGSNRLARDPINRNASKTEPANLFAAFVADSNDKELTIPVM